MCRNDEFSSMMSWVGCLLTDSDIFILFAENSQILLKISVIPILLTLMYVSGSTKFVSKQLKLMFLVLWFYKLPDLQL